MSDNTEAIAEVLELVEKAQAKGKFKLENVIKNVGYPEDFVDIYLDVESAYRLSKLNDELIVTIDAKEIEKLEAEAEKLKENILSSKLTFHMRGIDQKQIELLEAQAQERNKDNDDDDAWTLDYMCALIAANIVSVTDAAGNVDDSVFTLEDVKTWRETLPAEAWVTLSKTMQQLTLAVGYFKGLTDAGFLPKS